MPMNEESLFAAAIKHETDEGIATFLDEVCASDPALRERVEALIRSHREASGLLNPPVLDTADMSLPLETVGSTIGPYKLLQVIGKGGFGVVYMAEQSQPVERKVALKIIKPGMDSSEVIARFEAERQALAMMDHPNIARVLDAGQTENGRPYFAMELVRGVPITEYADKNQLAARARLELFVTVCRAVQHAHHKGIIHRDLKPSNVMVTLHDGMPVVKVIDFGVAKALNQKLTAKTLFTAYGQMIGTPQYMSPEQAEMSGLDVDTRSDVYSLGVLLYEILTGTTPLNAKQIREAGYSEIQRLIREQEAPPLSARLSTLGDELTVVAKHRSVEPGRLQQILSGELDWIVLRVLEKERGRRYASPGAFALDIERYLKDEAVEACPPSRIYQLTKFCRRHRGLVAAAGVIVASLLVCLCVATYSALAIGAQRNDAIAARVQAGRERDEAEKQRRVAENETARVTQILRVFNEMLDHGNPAAGGRPADFTVREMLDDFAKTIDTRFADDPHIAWSLHLTVGKAYDARFDLVNAVEHLKRARDLHESVSTNDFERAQILAALATPTMWYPEQWQVDLTKIVEEVTTVTEKYRDQPGESLAELHFSLALILGYGSGVQDNAACIQHCRRVIEIDEMQPGEYRTTANAMCVLAEKLPPSQEREAWQIANAAVESHLRLHGSNHIHTAQGWWILATLAQRKNDPARAEGYLKKAVAISEKSGSQFARLHVAWLSGVLMHQGKPNEMIAKLREMSEQDSRTDWLYAQYLALALWNIGDLDEAMKLLSYEAERMPRAAFGNDHSVAQIFRLQMMLALLDHPDQAVRARGRDMGTSLSSFLVNVKPAMVEQLPDEMAVGLPLAIAHMDVLTPEQFAFARKMVKTIRSRTPNADVRFPDLEFADALLDTHSGENDAAMSKLKRLFDERPGSFQWWRPTEARNRLVEDELAKRYLAAGDTVAAERIYRDGIQKREQAKFRNKFQIAFAQQRLAKFLVEHTVKHDEAQRLLEIAQETLVNAQQHYAWLRTNVAADLEGIDNVRPNGAGAK